MSSEGVARTPVGGATSILLGCDSQSDVFAQWKEEHKAAVETPIAAPRFTQAPGGTANVSFGGEALDAEVTHRGPVGGATSIVLGTHDTSDEFRQRKEHREAFVETPGAAPRFNQAPGGTSSVCLGGESACDAPVAATRGPVGGPSGICLGSDCRKEAFARRDEEHAASVKEPPAAAPRFTQAPGGESSICLSAEGVETTTVASRGPVGGAASIVLGNDSSAEIFAEIKEKGMAVVDTPCAAARFQQPPGGESSLGAGCTSTGAPPSTADADKRPVGGAATVILGSDSHGAFAAYQEAHQASFETPEAAPRFTQAPGGKSTVALGTAEDSGAAVPEVAVRGPVGGASSVCLGGGAALCEEGDTAVATRGPVGGAVSIVLGSADAKEMFMERSEQGQVAGPVPDAAPRFQQPPGGTSSLCLSNADAGGAPAVAVAARGPTGGVATVVLGGHDCKAVFDERQAERQASVETPDAAPRFSQAPGGNASICFTPGASDRAPTLRGPVGGASSVVLGSDDAEAAFRQYKEHHEVSVETSDAAPRFQQAPGGTASMCLGAAEAEVTTTAVRGPVGGATSIVLGVDDSNLPVRGDSPVLATPQAAPRFSQAPGGDATLCLSGENVAGMLPSTAAAAGSHVGGAASIVLGTDESREAFSQHSDERNKAVATPLAAPRFTQAPGGTSTVLLGGGTVSMAESSGLRQAPGGTSTLVLGGNYPNDLLPAVSASQFASGSHQNLGNVLTERSTTRVRHAPGGASSICLGGDEGVQAPLREASPDEHGTADPFPCLGCECSEDVSAKPSAKGVGTASQATATAASALPAAGAREGRSSSNCFASGANQNSGNTITDRPTTKLHQAPGGTSTLCLGVLAESTAAPPQRKGATQGTKRGPAVSDENVNTSNVVVGDEKAKAPLKAQVAADVVLG